MRELRWMNRKSLISDLSDLHLPKMGFKTWKMIFLDSNGFICCYYNYVCPNTGPAKALCRVSNCTGPPKYKGPIIFCLPSVGKKKLITLMFDQFSRVISSNFQNLISSVPPTSCAQPSKKFNFLNSNYSNTSLIPNFQREKNSLW